MRLSNRLSSSHRGRRRRFAPRIDSLETRALLSTLVVTNNDDSGKGSLRQAIADAASGDTIAFAHSLRGQTITLTSGALDITKSLDIDGLGASQLAVSGGGSSEVFNVASGTTVTISGLTITGGSAVPGRRDLQRRRPDARGDDVVTGNQSAGTFDRPGTAAGSTTRGTLSLDGSTVTDNLASGYIAQGGGIYNHRGPSRSSTQLGDRQPGDGTPTRPS